MQAKGYDWRAIASLLSEQGIAVTAATLKSHVAQAKTPSRRRTSRKRSGTEGSRAKTPPVAGEQKGTVTRRAAGGAETRSDRATLSPPIVAPKHPVEQAPKTGRSPAQDPASRRSAFVPEEDSDDL
ncbi:MAG: hypothetical protein ACRENE_09445 [Polyangiaceae bacterium]